MEGGGGAAINYLGYKFLLFCKVNTQPRRSVAGWGCWGENEQPELPMVGAGGGDERSPRVGSKWLLVRAEVKDPRKAAKEGKDLSAGAGLGAALELPGEGARPPPTHPCSSSQ